MKQIQFSTQIKEIDTINISSSNTSISNFSTIITNPTFSQNGQLILDSTTLEFSDFFSRFNISFLFVYSDNYFYTKETNTNNQIIVKKTKIFAYNNELLPLSSYVANGTFDIDIIDTTISLIPNMASKPVILKYFIYGSPQSPYSSQFNFPPIIYPNDNF